MPQMAPISWLILFFSFLFCLVLFSILNYFSYIPKPSQLESQKMHPIQPCPWKW